MNSKECSLVLDQIMDGLQCIHDDYKSSKKFQDLLHEIRLQTIQLKMLVIKQKFYEDK